MKIIEKEQFKESANRAVLKDAEDNDESGRYRFVTVDFFIAGVHLGKLRKGSGFENLGIDPSKEEINLVFKNRELLTIPVSKGTCAFEKINNTRYLTLVVRLKDLMMYITWS